MRPKLTTRSTSIVGLRPSSRRRESHPGVVQVVCARNERQRDGTRDTLHVIATHAAPPDERARGAGHGDRRGLRATPVVDLRRRVHLVPLRPQSHPRPRARVQRRRAGRGLLEPALDAVVRAGAEARRRTRGVGERLGHRLLRGDTAAARRAHPMARASRVGGGVGGGGDSLGRVARRRAPRVGGVRDRCARDGAVHAIRDSVVHGAAAHGRPFAAGPGRRVALGRNQRRSARDHHSQQAGRPAVRRPRRRIPRLGGARLSAGSRPVRRRNRRPRCAGGDLEAPVLRRPATQYVLREVRGSRVVGPGRVLRRALFQALPAAVPRARPRARHGRMGRVPGGFRHVRPRRVTHRRRGSSPRVGPRVAAARARVRRGLHAVRHARGRRLHVRPLYDPGDTVPGDRVRRGPRGLEWSRRFGGAADASRARRGRGGDRRCLLDPVTRGSPPGTWHRRRACVLRGERSTSGRVDGSRAITRAVPRIAPAHGDSRRPGAHRLRRGSRRGDRVRDWPHRPLHRPPAAGCARPSGAREDRTVLLPDRAQTRAFDHRAATGGGRFRAPVHPCRALLLRPDARLRADLGSTGHERAAAARPRGAGLLAGPGRDHREARFDGRRGGREDLRQDAALLLRRLPRFAPPARVPAAVDARRHTPPASTDRSSTQCTRSS